MPYSSTTIFSILCTLCCLSANVVAQKAATLYGTAPGLEGKEISLTSYQDPLSRTVNQQSTSIIDSTGAFNLSIKTESIAQVWIAIRRHQAPVILGPGMHCEIEISTENESVLINTWQKGELLYNFTGASAQQDSNDGDALNRIMAGIDAAYFNFFAENARLVGNKAIQPKIKALQADWEAATKPGSFEASYAAYTIAEMQLVAGLPKREVFKTSLDTAAIDFNHPAWYALFTLFFDKYFDQYSNRFGGMELYNRLTAGLNYTSLDSLLLEDNYLARADLRQAVILAGIAGSAYNARYPRPALISILRQMQEDESMDTALLDIARHLEKKLLHSGVGMQLSSLLPDFRSNGQRPTLVFISAPWSNASKLEAKALMELNETYEGIFDIIELSIEGTEQASTSPWPVHYPAHVEALMEGLEVYRIPQYIWLDESGKVEMLHAPAPSQGLESILYKRKSKIEDTNRIKVGDK